MVLDLIYFINVVESNWGFFFGKMLDLVNKGNIILSKYYFIRYKVYDFLRGCDSIEFGVG